MAITPQDKELYVAIWSKAVDTQMHFNEMSVKSRQFGLAFVAAALGLGVALLGDGKSFSIDFMGLKLHSVVLLVLSGAFALYAVKMLDLNVYHKMLRGAVAFGDDFEERYMKQIFGLEKGMTQAISHFSRYDDAEAKKNAQGKFEYKGYGTQTAYDKIESFYTRSISLLILTAGALFIITSGILPTEQSVKPDIKSESTNNLAAKSKQLTKSSK